MIGALLLAACVEIPFRWTPGQIEIPVSVNGRAPVWLSRVTFDYSRRRLRLEEALGLGR